MYSTRLSHQSAWAWTLKNLKDKLNTLLRQRDLPMSEGPLFTESIWEIASIVTGRGEYYPHALSLEEIETRLKQLRSNVTIVGSKTIGPDKIDLLRQSIQTLRDAGETALMMPWPPCDRLGYGSWIWESYSDEQFLVRTVVVYTAAIEGYERLVRVWFPTFAPYLRTYVMLPARLVGFVKLTNEDDSWSSPLMTWYWEVLPKGEQNIVDIRFGDAPFNREYFNIKEFSSKHLQRMRELRPQTTMPLSFLLVDSLIGDVAQSSPVTKLVYNWLWDDLRYIGWDAD